MGKRLKKEVRYFAGLISLCMKRARRVIQYVVFLIVGVLLLYWALRGIDLDQVKQYVLSADYRWVLAALFVTWVSHVLRGWRWALLLEGIGYRPSAAMAYHSLIIGYLMNMVFPRAGEVTRCVALNRLAPIPFSTVLGSVLVERGLDLLFLAGLIGLNLLLEFDLLMGLADELHLSMPTATTWLWLVGGLVAAALFFWWMFRRFRGATWMLAVREKIRQLVQGLATIRHVRRPWLFWSQSVAIWALYWLMTYLPLKAFDFSADLSPVAGLTVFTISSVGFIMPVQAGIGTYHWAAATALGLYGIPWDKGMTLALVMHSTQMLLIVFLGAISSAWYFYRLMQRKKHDRSAGTPAS